MKLIDMHCDTILKLMDVDEGADLMDNHCSVSIPFMKEADTKAQFFACFTYLKDFEDKDGYEGCYERVQEMIHYLKRQTHKFQEQIGLAGSFEEMQKNEAEGKISAVLTVEEGGILCDRIGRLDTLYENGIRLMTLMWNYENCIGYPNSREAAVMSRGLKPFGIEVVRRMNALGMIIDISHASDGTFWEVLKYSEKPLVASHSNCRALCKHPRNLSDNMIRSLASSGGIAGVNFYGAFLGTGNEKEADIVQADSKVDAMKAHILHMLKVGGSEFPAIGTDFDGFDAEGILEIPDVSKMERLWDALKKAGVSEDQLDLIWSGNVERVMRETLRH